LLSFGAEYFVFRFAIRKYKSKIHVPVIMPVVLYEYETWSFTLREERRLMVFENRMLRRILKPKSSEATGNGENYIMRNLICAPHLILFR